MLFNSVTFLVFLVVVFVAYWGLRARVAQNVLLLAASYLFYGAWSWKFLALLVATTLVDYACARLIGTASSPRMRRAYATFAVVSSLGVLAAFKYLGFLVAETARFLQALGFEPHVPVLEIVLPIGISFYTFQSIGYVVDVYRGKLAPTRSLLNYALYVAFFPQLVAGPIERASHLLPQFERPRRFDGAALESGLTLIAWGLFKKVVIADNLAPYVDVVYAQPQQYAGPVLVTATVFFAFQIYCDFSGYTDVARGTARLLGFELVRNFDRPYVSRNPVEFWRRWHISLSQWFQDYLYFPLAMRYLRRGGWASRYRAHLVSMGLIGLWHGASWTFVAFGLYWGCAIAAYVWVTERAAASPGSTLARVLESDAQAARWCAVAGMFVVVCIGWVLFRAESLSDAAHVLTHALVPGSAPDAVHAGAVPPVAGAALIALLLAAEWAQRRFPTPPRIPRLLLRQALLASVVFSYVATQRGVPQPFIYFQF